MGLDITSNNDHFRFNWSGTSSFGAWNAKHKMPEPFPNWGGDNSGDEVCMTDEDDREAVMSWIKAFERKFPNLARMGSGERIRYTQFAMIELGKNQDKWTDKQEEEWEQYTALGWYWFLKDKLQTESDQLLLTLQASLLRCKSYRLNACCFACWY